MHHMRRQLTPVPVVFLLVAVATGCAAAEQAAPPAQPPGEIAMNPTLSSVTEAVLADAATRTGMERAALKVESAQAVTWADGSLGCPQPGMSYTMALVPGYRIKVRAGEQVLDYHASQRGYLLVCPAGMSEDPAVEETM
jgi:hypothetical protein